MRWKEVVLGETGGEGVARVPLLRHAILSEPTRREDRNESEIDPSKT